MYSVKIRLSSIVDQAEKSGHSGPYWTGQDHLGPFLPCYNVSCESQEKVREEPEEIGQRNYAILYRVYNDKDASDYQKKSNEMSSSVRGMSDRQPGVDELYCIMPK